jgi:mono/diheme cytochrome c family protein
MSGLDDASAIPIRPDIAAAQARAWERIARAGAWWDGAQRVAIAAETRHAPNCALCHRRKAALSPAAETGEHDSLGALPEAIVEIVHGVRTDPGRLSERWYRGVLADGVSAEQYVETVSIVAHIVAIDTMARALGREPPRLPTPQPGSPSGYRPRGAKPGPAWVPWVEPEDAEPGTLGHYPTERPAANIQKALSLVPAEAEGFFDLVVHQYLPGPAMRDFAREYRAITHAQIELLAARVSALNQCLY